VSGPVSEKAPITESSFLQRQTHTHTCGFVLFYFSFESVFETNPKCFPEFCTSVLSERLRVEILAVNKLHLGCRGSMVPKVVWEICGCLVVCAFARTNPSHHQLDTRLSVACTSLSAICHTLSKSLSTLLSLVSLFLSSFPLHPPPHEHKRTQA